MNKAQIIGNITQDIEMKQTPSWQNVVSTSIATNANYTDKDGVKQQRADFHNIVAWGKTAELINQYVKKWDKLYVEWRMQTRNWEKEWVKHYRTEIIVDHIEFLTKKSTTESWQAPAPQVNSTPAPDQSNQKPKYNTEEISVEDIPF